MTLNHINVDAAVANVRQLLAQETTLSPALRSALDVLILIVQWLVGRLSLNSRNSSQPPSKDRFPIRTKKPSTAGRHPGGQPGRVGATLNPVADPDVIEFLPIDRRTLPPGTYEDAGYESRQVFDIDIQRVVTEYRAQVLRDTDGRRIVAPFPAAVTKAVQYGNGVKAQAVYLSQYQLIPYQRVQEHFQDSLQLPISAGSVFAFNQPAYALLERFEQRLLAKLRTAPVLHADETGINIDGKHHWLHCLSSPRWTLFYAHAQRGLEAMTVAGVLPQFTGILVHDHGKPYFHFACLHALCNAHHLRELTYAHEQEDQAWARRMSDLLQAIQQAVLARGGALPEAEAADYRTRYRALLKQAEAECPPPQAPKTAGRRGRLKRSKSRNLLERLIHYETETLRFMTDAEVPFTNNPGENDIRMTNVQQKISGCFRSQDGAHIFCRVRSYLSTCRKNQVSATQALALLFDGALPDFIL